MSANIAATRAVRTTLDVSVEAANAGVIDDVNFLRDEGKIDAALLRLKEAREEYFRHQVERHRR